MRYMLLMATLSIAGFFILRRRRWKRLDEELQPLQEARNEYYKAVHEVVQQAQEATEHKMKALIDKISAVRRRLKVSPLNWLWPSRRYLLFCAIRERLNKRIGDLYARMVWIIGIDRVYYETSLWEKGIYKPGMEACQWVMAEQFNHPGLQEALKSLDASAQRLTDVIHKLGLDVEPWSQRVKAGTSSMIKTFKGWFKR